MDALAIFKSFLSFNKRLRLFIVPPLLRLQPAGFKDDMAVCQVFGFILVFLAVTL